VARFLTEARAAARLNHPNIVQIYDCGHGADGHYLAMEYVDGRTLGSLLKERGLLDESEAIGVTRQACGALGVAHRAGIAHRDVKPDNMMITDDGIFKLVDLGLAKDVDEEHSQTGTGMTLGSPYYISPEQIRSAKTIDHRADIYSLGATLYHMTTGRIPYDGSSGPHIMSRHLTDPLPDPRRHRPELSDGICRVIRAMMAKDPEERYQDVQAVDHDLALLKSGEDPAPPDPSLSGVARNNDLPGMTAGPVAPSLVIGADLRERIENEMMGAIGPVGQLLVDSAIVQSATFEELTTKLSLNIAEQDRQRRFIERCQQHRQAADSGAELKLSTEAFAVDVPTAEIGTIASLPVVEPISDTWSEEQLAKIETELMRHIGPLGRILVSKAAKDATTIDHLAASLSENIPDESRRQAFVDFVSAL
jgi:serine/threonine protein kinase